MSLLVPLLPHETITVSARHLAHFKTNSISFWDATQTCDAKGESLESRCSRERAGGLLEQDPVDGCRENRCYLLVRSPLLNFIFKEQFTKQLWLFKLSWTHAVIPSISLIKTMASPCSRGELEKPGVVEAGRGWGCLLSTSQSSCSYVFFRLKHSHSRDSRCVCIGLPII